MRRRALLSIIGGILTPSAVSGCLRGPRSPSRRLQVELVESIGPRIAIRPGEFTAAQTELVASIRRYEYAKTYGHRPFSPGEFLRIDDTYFRVSSPETGSKTIPRMVLLAERVDSDVDAIRVDDLPAHTQEPVRIACRLALGQEATRNGRTLAGPHPDGYVFRTIESGETDLLPEPNPDVVDMDGHIFRLTVEKRQIIEPEYTTRLEVVAESDREIESVVIGTVVVDLDTADLTVDERDVLDSLVSEGYYDMGYDETGASVLLDRLHSGYVESGRRFFRYRGEFFHWSLIDEGS